MKSEEKKADHGLQAFLTLAGRLFQLLADAFPALARMHAYALRVSSLPNHKQCTFFPLQRIISLARSFWVDCSKFCPFTGAVRSRGLNQDKRLSILLIESWSGHRFDQYYAAISGLGSFFLDAKIGCQGSEGSTDSDELSVQKICTKLPEYTNFRSTKSRTTNCSASGDWDVAMPIFVHNVIETFHPLSLFGAVQTERSRRWLLPSSLSQRQLAESSSVPTVLWFDLMFKPLLNRLSEDHRPPVKHHAVTVESKVVDPPRTRIIVISEPWSRFDAEDTVE